MSTYRYKIMKEILLIIAVTLLIFLGFFGFGWFGHAQYIQEWVKQDIVEFQDVDITWSEYDFDQDHRAVRDDFQKILIARIHVLHISAFRDELDEYIHQVSGLFGKLNLDRQFEVDQEIVDQLTETQSEFYRKADRFTDNVVYAMWHTF